jgi:hypothetical protein
MLWEHFKDRPIDFERCAVELLRLAAPGVQNVDVTRPSRDGGRDAIGQYAIGPAADPIRLDFALEAKCYKPGNSVGVKELARLISRIKHRGSRCSSPPPTSTNRHTKRYATTGTIIIIIAGQTCSHP